MAIMTELLKGYERKGPMGLRSRAWVTSNIINYFFGVLNLAVFGLLWLDHKTDPASCFFLMALSHFLLAQYENTKETIWKRYATLILSNLCVFLLSFAIPKAEVLQLIFFILLIGLIFLTFNGHQRLSLGLWFIIPFSQVIYVSVTLLKQEGLDSFSLTVYVALVIAGAFAIATGLGTVVFKIRQIQLLLEDILDSTHLRNKKASGFSSSEIQQIKANLSEKEEFYKLLASYSNDIILLCDSEGRINYLSPSVEKVLGYTPTDVVGKNILSFIGPLFGNLEDGQFSQDFCVKTSNGEQIWLEGNIQKIYNHNGEHVQTHAILRDVTERKNSEEQLLIAKKNAEEASLAKERFLSTMTHEIRTPLNAVIGMSKILLDESPRKSQLDLLTTLHYSAENLLTLINDILDFSKMSVDKIQLEEIPFRLSDEVEKLVHSMKYKANEQGNMIRYETDQNLPSLVKGDLHRLKQVLTNLIGNACKFTENGAIKISCKMLKVESGRTWIRFAVADNGIGIDEEKQKSIFEEFNQADASISRKYGGTGLGLAICKLIVEQMDGKIWAEGKKDEGATFFFEIPFSEAQKNHGKNSLSADPLISLSPLHILTVDDNQINQLVLDRFLKKWGVSFKQACNGREAIELANSEKFDIILMDLEMPEVDGYTASQQIRANSCLNSETPLVALTASTISEVEARVYEAGMNDVMMKPFNPGNLHRMLERYVPITRNIHKVA